MNEFYENNQNIEPKKKQNYLVVIGIVLFLGIVAILLVSLFQNKNSYSHFEKKMISASKKYIKNNNIEINKETYILSSKLDVELPDTCSITSGVLVKDNNYIAYLSCIDYESDIIDNENENMTLNGKEVYVIPTKVNFYDPGYVSSEKLSTIGNVLNEEGVYNLYYISDSGKTLMRKIIVVNDQSINDIFPSISLLGNEVVYMLQNNEYAEMGVEAMDVKDGDISDNAIVLGNVDTSKIGEYDLIYQIINSQDNANQTSRKVIVLSNQCDLSILHTLTPKEKTNNNVEIKISVTGEGYAYTLLPNGERELQDNFLYTVQENGTYKFMAYDEFDRIIEKEITIDNISREGPNATCTAKVYSDYVQVNVESSNSKIVKYNYSINDEKSGYIALPTYTKNTIEISKVSVNVVDNIGNEGNINCTVSYQDPSVNNKNVRYYTYNGVEYVVPVTHNDIDTFVKAVTNKISQSADVANCGSSCLSFALYHAVYLQKRDLGGMNLNAACHYGYNQSYKANTNKTKADALKMVQSEILKGRVSVLQVTGAVRTSIDGKNHRHFMTVVGYRRSKYLAKDLIEDDLLLIDAWSGALKTISYTDLSKRTMYDDGNGLGYRVDTFKD